MLAGCLTLPESTRWLLSKGRSDEAWKSLIWIRGSEGSRTQDEFTETHLGLRAEEIAKESFRFKELLEPANRLRFFIGPVMFIFQNTTGSSALAVFAPQYFKLLVGSTGTRDLLLTGLFGAVKVIACTFFIWVLSERFGRRTLLTGGSAMMAICMLITALIVDEIPTESSSNVTSAGRATVAMIYLDIMVSPAGKCGSSQGNSPQSKLLLTQFFRFITVPGVHYHGRMSPKSSRLESEPSVLQPRCWLTGLLPCASRSRVPT